MAEEAGKKIVELRNRLAEREMITAELYRKLYSNKAALVYYDVIIDEYPDTELYEAAFVGKLEVLTALKRYEDVKIALELYKKRFIHGKLADDVQSIEQQLPAD